MKEKNMSKIILLLSIIVIIVMFYFIYNFYNEKVISNKKLLNQNSINYNNEYTSEVNNTNSNKYIELTKEIYNQLAQNEYLVIQNVVQSNDSAIILKGRIYKDVELNSISKNEYDLLISQKSISLFGEIFSLGKYEDFIPGYELKNSNGYGFYVTDNYELVNFNNTSFVKGTDKYYSLTLDNNVKLKFPDDTEELITPSSIETISNYNFINLSAFYNFEFTNGKVSKIIIGI